MAEGLNWTCVLAAVPGPGGWSSDYTALRPAGGNRTSDWTLLLLLCCTGSEPQSPGWCCGQEAMGGQRETLWPLLRWNKQSFSIGHADSHGKHVLPMIFSPNLLANFIQSLLNMVHTYNILIWMIFFLILHTVFLWLFKKFLFCGLFDLNCHNSSVRATVEKKK